MKNTKKDLLSQIEKLKNENHFLKNKLIEFEVGIDYLRPVDLITDLGDMVDNFIDILHPLEGIIFLEEIYNSEYLHYFIDWLIHKINFDD